ncbi:hypothetical protein [Pelagibacterium limicola]|nr:hypothetical protein [Pelagibacterium limicola]
MNVIPRLKSTVAIIGEKIERIRLYQSFVLYSEAHHALPPSARLRLGLED